MEALLHRTSRSLSLLTLMLIAVLLAAAGFVTAAIAMSAMDQSVDRTLQASAARMAETVQSSSESENGSEDGTTGGEDGATGGQAAPPVGTVGGETDERPPEASDTFFLVLDQNGNVIANPQRVGLAGLPNPDAVNAALTSVSGEDWRTVDVGGVHVRLLTQRLSSDEAGLSYLLQSGYVLTLHDEQTAQMLMSATSKTPPIPVENPFFIKCKVDARRRTRLSPHACKRAATFAPVLLSILGVRENHSI